MRVTCVGGGPAGLYFSLLLKLGAPQHDVTVLERNTAGTPRGWGVTMNREILDNIAANDPALARALARTGAHRTRQAVEIGGQRKVRERYSVYSIPRKALVDALASRATEVGVRISYGHEVNSPAELPQSDLIVAADGARSRLRTAVGGFGTSTHYGSNKYIWLGSSAPFEAFSYIFVPTDHGWVWAYAYQFDPGASTVIVECSSATFAGLGLGAMPVPDGVDLLSGLFKKHLTGHPLTARLPDGMTASWQSFPTVSNQRWHSGRVVLLGDSAHTAHYSLGQGTKMALEDAACLAGALRQHPEMDVALTAFETRRKAELMRPLSDARCSADWFENLPRYLALKPHQFAVLLDSRWSPLVRALPPLASYYLQLATERFSVLRGIHDRVGPAVKVLYGRRAITREGLSGT